MVSSCIEWSRGDARTLRLGVAPILKYSETPSDENAGHYITSLDPAPRGFGRFGQAGGRAWLDLDTRDNPAWPTSGLHVEASGEAYPALLDADDPFGRVEGSVSGYATPLDGAHAPTLAVRIGGARAVGAFPFHEAAFLGGHRDLRGSREQRFAGDGALYANAEVRVPVLSFDLLFPRPAASPWRVRCEISSASSADRVAGSCARPSGPGARRAFAEAYTLRQKIQLVRIMQELVDLDGVVSPGERYLLRKLGTLLRIDRADITLLERRVRVG